MYTQTDIHTVHVHVDTYNTISDLTMVHYYLIHTCTCTYMYMYVHVHVHTCTCKVALYNARLIQWHIYTLRVSDTYQLQILEVDISVLGKCILMIALW